jgi:chromosome partitioning protein
MRNTVAVMNTKGVIGKSTIVVALAEALATFHKKSVLLIDSDPQASISSLLMTPAHLHQLQCEALTLAGFLVSTVINKTPALWPNFAVRQMAEVDGARGVYLIPGGIQLTLFERMVSKDNLRAKLDAAIGRLLNQVRPVFDLVLIDCPAGHSMFTQTWRRKADFHVSLSKSDGHGTGGDALLCGSDRANLELRFAKDLGIVINMNDSLSARAAPLAPPDGFYHPHNGGGDAGHLGRALAEEILARLGDVNGRSHETGDTMQTRALG